MTGEQRVALAVQHCEKHATAREDITKSVVHLWWDKQFLDGD